MNVAMPWNSNSKPNAFVSFSNPSKSTKITEVSPTYAPIVKPNTTEYTTNDGKSSTKTDAAVAKREYFFLLIFGYKFDSIVEILPTPQITRQML